MERKKVLICCEKDNWRLEMEKKDTLMMIVMTWRDKRKRMRMRTKKRKRDKKTMLKMLKLLKILI